MRLWHVDLIKYLPDPQLLAQYRELNSIYVKQDKHILINYIYDYDKEYLLWYSDKVIEEMRVRGFKIKTLDNYNNYFAGIAKGRTPLKYPEHNKRYLKQCYMNLQEKFDRGQKGFTPEIYEKLWNFIINQLGEGGIDNENA